MNIRAVIINTFSFCLGIASIAYSAHGILQNRPAEVEIIKPTVISTSHYDIDHDGKKEVIEIVLTKGKWINETEPWCGAGDRWEGDFTMRIRKGERVLSKLSLNECMGRETLSFYGRKVTLFPRDYNGDGDIDFNLGQYGVCDGNEYWLFTIRKNGKIEPLPIEDGHPLFIQGPGGFNSTDEITLENDLIKNTYYDRDREVEHVTWYKWNGTKFAIAKNKETSFREPFTAFSIKNEQLIGTWQSFSGDEKLGSATLNTNGTFKSTCDCGEEATGKWFIRDNHLIWVYDEDHNDFKKGQEDINIILDFKTDQFLLREMTGSRTTFKRSPGWPVD